MLTKKLIFTHGCNRFFYDYSRSEMTNRRKGSKAKASLSKKSESPEKQSRRVSRRGRRSRKSDSPEQPEEVCSEYSVDENTEEDEGKTGYDNDRVCKQFLKFYRKHLIICIYGV